MLAVQKPAVMDTLRKITLWEHWGEIQKVAAKEYQLSAAEFNRILPEYQKFMALLSIHGGLEMCSEQVDKIWHAHILHSRLYHEFGLRYLGRYVHHVPNLSENSTNECVTPEPCASRCVSICKTPAPEPLPDDKQNNNAFEQKYTFVFGPLPALWGMTSDGLAQ